MKNNDTQLIRLTLEGDDTAFAELVEKYQKQVHALVWRKIGDFHIAEEITQDTFLKAYNNLATLKQSQSFASWLYVIATSRCNSWLQKKYRRTQLMQGIDTLHPQKTTYSEHVLEENERIAEEAQREVVKKLLAKLGESERTVMTLHYFGEMSCSEIGKFMGVSTNTIKSRLRRAQQRLQKEETMIREALDNFQITPYLTENVMREISRINPTTPNSSKPVVPWAIAASTLAVVLLILGFGNSKYLTRFQKPYSFDANAEMTVEIIDAPVVANLESDPDVQLQIRNTNTLAKLNHPKQQQDDNITALSEDTHTEETMKDYTQWELPENTIARLGKGKVNGIKFTPDSTHLAVETTIGVWLYDANTGEEITLFPNVEPDNQSLDRSYINMLVSAIDRNTIACEGLDEDRGLWDVENDNLESIQPDLRRRNNVLQFRAESTLLSYPGWKMKLPWHGRADLWNHSDGADESIKPGLMTALGMQIAISPDERFLAAAQDSRFWIKELKIPIFQLWDRTTGKCVFTVEKSEHDIETLVFSPDSKTLAYAESSNIIKILDVENGSLQYTIKAAVPFQRLAFSPDGSLLASGSTDGIVRFWKVDNHGKQSISDRVRNFAGKPVPHKMLKGHAANTKFTAIDFSPDGKKVVSANSDGTVRLWDADTGKQQLTLTQHSESQTALAFNAIRQSNLSDTPNRTLTSVGTSNSHYFVSVWDIDTGNRLSIDRIEKGHRSWYGVAVSPDGSLFVTNERVVRLWDTQTISVLSTISDNEYDASFGDQLVFSPDGKRLAVTARKDNTIQIWDMSNRKTLCRLKGHTTYVYSLAFSPDNKTIVTSGWTPKDVTIRLWDTMTGELLASFPDQGAVAFAPDGNTFVGGTHIYAWNPETIQYDRTVRLEDVSKSNPPTALTFSPDGSIIVSGNRDGIIRLRDATNGKIIFNLTGHINWISQFVFSEDGTTLATSGADGTILLWNWDEVLKKLAGE